MIIVQRYKDVGPVRLLQQEFGVQAEALPILDILIQEQVAAPPSLILTDSGDVRRDLLAQSGGPVEGCGDGLEITVAQARASLASCAGSAVVIWTPPLVALRSNRVPCGPFRTTSCWMLLNDIRVI